MTFKSNEVRNVLGVNRTEDVQQNQIGTLAECNVR